jgi:hypothetical protein
MTMKLARSMTVTAALFLPVVVLASGCTSCKKDDDDKPATTASAAPPAPAPTPVAPATVVPEEDAGAPVDAGIDAAKPPSGPGGSPPGSIAKCCAALQQNVNSAPLEQKAYYMAAAQYCQGAKNTPAAQQAFVQIRSFLAGAKMPGACR